MNGMQTGMPAVLLAAMDGGDGVHNFPLAYQIAFVILAAVFVWIFSIVRNPRGWRRLYQVRFARGTEFSVNRNKRLDEMIKAYGYYVAMTFLVAAVWVFVAGVTYRVRHFQKPMSQEDKNLYQDTERIVDRVPKEKIRRALGQ